MNPWEMNWDVPQAAAPAAPAMPWEMDWGEPAGKPTGLARALEPITSYPGTVGQMYNEGAEQYARGLGQIGSGVAAATKPEPVPDTSPAWLRKPTIWGTPQSGEGLMEIYKGIGNTAVGTIGAAASPINAGLRTVVGKPVEEVTGIPKEYTEFAAALALPVPKRIPFTGGQPSKAAPTAAPTVEELKGSYVAAKGSPEVEAVAIKPEALAGVADNIAAELAAKKFSPVRAKETFSILDDLKSAPPAGATVTMANIDDLRYQLGLVAGGSNKTDAAAAVMAKKKLDQWAESGGAQSDVLAGDLSAAQARMAAGRGDYSRAMLGGALDKRVAGAELRAGSTYSGENLQNALRQNVRGFLQSEQSASLTAGERKLMEQFVMGSTGENISRWVANKLGNMFTLGGSSTLGAILGGPAGAVAGAAASGAGFGLKYLNNTLKARDAERLSEMVRANSPLGRQTQASLEAWTKYADVASAEVASSQTITPRTMSMLLITSRNLATNLKDAGISTTPGDLLRSVVPGSMGTRGEQEQP